MRRVDFPTKLSQFRSGAYLFARPPAPLMPLCPAPTVRAARRLDSPGRQPRRAPILLVLALTVLFAGCGSAPQRSPDTAAATDSRENSGRGQEAALFALGLLDTGYRFGGKNPEAGLDCSGMVAYVFRQSTGLNVSGSAATIARSGRKIDPAQAQAGDLVFFNTRGGPHTHVGIYLGEGRFIHAPSTASGKVRLDSLKSGYFSDRLTEARAYFD